MHTIFPISHVLHTRVSRCRKGGSWCRHAFGLLHQSTTIILIRVTGSFTSLHCFSQIEQNRVAFLDLHFSGRVAVVGVGLLVYAAPYGIESVCLWERRKGQSSSIHMCNFHADEQQLPGLTCWERDRGWAIILKYWMIPLIWCFC